VNSECDFELRRKIKNAIFSFFLIIFKIKGSMEEKQEARPCPSPIPFTTRLIYIRCKWNNYKLIRENIIESRIARIEEEEGSRGIDQIAVVCLYKSSFLILLIAPSKSMTTTGRRAGCGAGRKDII
jgi:hypothetical protein